MEEYGIEANSVRHWKLEILNSHYRNHCPTDSPYVIIGDDAFALKSYLMKPYPQQDLDLQKRVCNYRFSRARRILENVFGLLANQWQVFGSPIALCPNKVEVVTMATVMLHNWLIKGPSRDVYAPPAIVDTVNPSTSEVVPGSWRNDCSFPSANLLPLARLSHGNLARQKCQG